MDLFEQLVFGKLYFDYRGLILAFDGERPVGFAHASFGPDDEGKRISRECGVICAIVVRPDCNEAEAAAGLLEACETYLRASGAKVVFGGAIRPLAPFYLGLYGGCDLPGVLDSDLVARRAYTARGYQEVDRTVVFRRGLASFQMPADRQQVQFRRRMVVQVIIDPPSRTWWEACTTGDFDLVRFELVPRGGGAALAQALVRAMDWANPCLPGRAAGIIDLHVQPAQRRQGLATLLLSEAFRTLTGQGFAVVEAQATEANALGIALFKKLGFEEVSRGTVFRKELAGP